MKSGKHIEFLDLIKVLVVLLLLILQFVVIYIFIILLGNLATFYYFLIEIIGILIALKILGSTKKYIYKLSWTTFLVALPVTAIVFYLLFGDRRFMDKYRKMLDDLNARTETCQAQDYYLATSVTDPRLHTDINSLYKLSKYPAYYSKDLKYYTVGEDFFEAVIQRLEEAENYILIEFYKMARGKLFDRIKKILFEKAEQGVEIYIIFDRMGSLLRFGKEEIAELESHGIKVHPFNSSIVHLYRFVSYRTHRKIVVVDGKYGFTGGNNLADEYVNVGSKYGHWKDMGVQIHGFSTNSFISAFFKLWMLTTGEEIDINSYQSEVKYPEIEDKNDGVVVPFTDEPTNELDTASQNYMRIISSASDYVYITTPYLIIDEEMIAALKLSAKSGVDVKIIIPGIADKKFVYQVSKAHIAELIIAGVQIFTYDPGFIHGKTIVSDDKFTTVGSVNFDFRSLMWNLECAVYAADKSLASVMRDDYEKMLEISTCINESHMNSLTWYNRYFYGILRLLGPLL